MPNKFFPVGTDPVEAINRSAVKNQAQLCNGDKVVYYIGSVRHLLSLTRGEAVIAFNGTKIPVKWARDDKMFQRQDELS